ncbi:MAG: carboxypeptidase-like regulatory domain-containing protein, partial [Acidimicrobiales bacterium]
ATSDRTSLVALGGPPAVGAEPRYGAVRGTVTVMGAPVTGARVTLSAGPTVIEARADLSGSFALDRVDPGEWEIVVADPGDSTPVCTPDGACITARPARAESRTVTVAAGADTQADFDL